MCAPLGNQAQGTLELRTLFLVDHLDSLVADLALNYAENAATFEGSAYLFFLQVLGAALDQLKNGQGDTLQEAVEHFTTGELLGGDLHLAALLVQGVLGNVHGGHGEMLVGDGVLVL